MKDSPFILTKGYFEEYFDPGGQLHQNPPKSLKEAERIAKTIVDQWPDDLGGISVTQFGLSLWNWYNKDALVECACHWCRERRRNNTHGKKKSYR